MKFLLVLAATVVLSACGVNKPIVQYDSFDNLTEISTPKTCSYKVQLSQKVAATLCLTMALKVRGNITSEQLSTMTQEQADHYIVGRYVEWEFQNGDWLFVESLAANIDGRKYNIFGALDNREVGYGGNITEWKKVKLVENSEMHMFYRQVTQGKFKGKPTTIRVYGKNYYTDFNFN